MLGKIFSFLFGSDEEDLQDFEQRAEMSERETLFEEVRSERERSDERDQKIEEIMKEID